MHRENSAKVSEGLFRQSIWLAPAFALIVLLCWALASPVSSSPDDEFHLPSSWCGLGLRTGLCESASSADDRRVEVGLARSAQCYARLPLESAECAEGLVGSDRLVTTDRVNVEGSYPPVYYAVTGLLASRDVAASAVGIRALNAVLLVALMTALVLLLPAHRRAGPVVAAVITTVPLGLFFVASNNPTSWALTACALVFNAVAGALESTGRRRVALGIIAVVAAVVGAGARADTAIYLVMAAIAAIVVAPSGASRRRIGLLVPAAVVIVSALFYLAASQVGVAAGGLGRTGGSGGSDFVALLGRNIQDIPGLLFGVFGSMPLGWLDTVLPAIVWVSAGAVFAGIAYTGLQASNLRKAIVLGVLAAAVVAIPTYILTRTHAIVGEGVQSRYMLPLITIIAAVALYSVGGRLIELGTVPRILSTALLSVAQAVALHQNMRRYVTGTDVGGWNLDAGAEWWWHLPFPPMAVWIVGTLAFTGLLVCLVTRRMSDSGPFRVERDLPVG